MRFLQIFNRQPRPDEDVWHEILFSPVAGTIEGRWVTGEGKIWRRKRNGKWEYQEDQETSEEWNDRQW